MLTHLACVLNFTSMSVSVTMHRFDRPEWLLAHGQHHRSAQNALTINVAAAALSRGRDRPDRIADKRPAVSSVHDERQNRPELKGKGHCG